MRQADALARRGLPQAAGDRGTAACLPSAVLDALQWPAMLATVLAAWLVASRHAGKRRAGFWVFLLSNVLWVVWGWSTSAWALVTLQFALAALNLRGARKNDDAATDEAGGSAAQ